MIKILNNQVVRKLQVLQTLRYQFGNWKRTINDFDTANLVGYLQLKAEPHLTFSQKLSELSFNSLYTGFDQFTRELLFTLSIDYGLGLTASIIICTVALKTIFLYPTLKSQALGLKMNQLKHLTEAYKDKVKAARMTNNSAMMKQASYTYKMALRKKGINQSITFINILQLPILMTWFLSLRHISNLPEIYPMVLSEGLFWFTDLSTFDPYFLLPFAAACATSLSITKSPNFARNNTMPMLAPFIKYMKFLPFFSLAFTSFFPACINVYWLTLGCYQLFISLLMHNKTIRTKIGLAKETSAPLIKFQEAIFVEEKSKSQEIMNQAKEEHLIPQKPSSEAQYDHKKVEILKHRPLKKKVELKPEAQSEKKL